MILKVQRKDYEDAANKVERASKDYAAAVVRVTAVNNKFQYSAGGAWAVAQALVCGNLEEKLRAVKSGLENLSTNIKDTGSDINNLFIARNDVFQKVNASANNVDTSAFQDGSVAEKDLSAQSGVQDVRRKAQDIIDACEGLEHSNSITSSLKDLQAKCTSVDNSLIDLLGSFDSYKDLVSDLNDKSALFNPDKFITEDMVTQAHNDTSTNLSFAHHWKGDLKLVKNYTSIIGESLQNCGKNKFALGIFEDFTPWKTGTSGWKNLVGASIGKYSRKLSEGTQGLDPLLAYLRRTHKIQDFFGEDVFADSKSFLGQHKANLGDVSDGAKSIGSHIKSKVNLSNAASKGVAKASTAEDIVQASSKVDWGTVGKGVKAAGRYAGYAGDAFTAYDAIKASWDVGFSQGKVGQGIGQIAKGVAKIGAGKILGAVIGTAFGGPAGAVVGMAIGGVAGALVDKGIDWAFSQFGVKEV